MASTNIQFSICNIQFIDMLFANPYIDWSATRPNRIEILLEDR
jgi:hypothetical protein